jgi:IS1 family transposase
MNKLSLDKRCKIVQLLVEGNSLRSCSRIVDSSINTVTNVLVSVGKACMKFQDQMIIGVECNRLEIDEIWAFIQRKSKGVFDQKRDNTGDAWTFIGMDSDTKLVIAWYVGERTLLSTKIFMRDLASKISTNVQLTTDGFSAYPEAVRLAFDDIDYAQLDKQYGIGKNKSGVWDKRKRYVGAEKKIISGNPEKQFISTSYIERQNLTLRMSNKRFARKTNAFSKKLENHCYSLALHFCYYNFIRIHSTLRVPPAMEAGLIKKVMNIEDLVKMSENSN